MVLPDWLASIVYHPAYLGMLLLLGGAVTVLFYVSWRCLNGDTRTWAALPPAPFQVSRNNTWPFMLLMCGVALMTALPSVLFEAWGMDGARQATWTVFLVPLALVALSFFWWPVAWTPAWYRRFAAERDRTPDAGLWSAEEIERVTAAPESRRRDRALTDIARLVGEEHVAGHRKDTWLDREVERVDARNEEMGITEDMDSIERALAIKASRKRARDEKRRRG